MQIGGIKNQSLIQNKHEVKTDKKPSDSDNVSLGSSGAKMDDILNYKNLAAQKAFTKEENALNEKLKKHIIGIQGGAAIGAFMALVTGTDMKAGVAVALLGAGIGAVGAREDLLVGLGLGTLAGTALGLMTNVNPIATAVVGAIAGGTVNWLMPSSSDWEPYT